MGTLSVKGPPKRLAPNHNFNQSLSLIDELKSMRADGSIMPDDTLDISKLS